MNLEIARHKPTGRRGPRRVHRPLPVRVGPAGGAQVQAPLQRGDLSGGFFEELCLLGIFHGTKPGC